MGQFIRKISTEFIKSKKTFAWWLVIVGAAFTPFFVSFIFLSKWRHLIPQPGHNPWDEFTEMSWKLMGFMYTPFFVVLLTCLFFNIEHKNNTWKHIFTLPIRKGNIFFEKLLTLIVFIAIFYLLYIPIWIGCGYVVGLIKPQLKLTAHMPDYLKLFNLCFHSFVSSLGLLSIHFWLSIRFKNMIIPIGIAVLCGIIWLVLYQGRAEEITYFPYSYHYSTVNPPDWIKVKMFGIFPEHEILSLTYFICLTALSYRDFVKNINA